MLAHTESPKGDNEDRNNVGVDSYWDRNIAFSKVPTKTTDVRKIKGWQKKSFAVTHKDNISLTVIECQQKLEKRKLKCLESEDSLPPESLTATVINKSDLRQQMDLKSQEESNISTCSNTVNAVDQEKSSSFSDEIITGLKRKFYDSFGNNSKDSICKKIKFEFPASDEVFSENFICGDSKKGRAAVTVASQSAFVSEELQNFLNFNSNLNIDYEIPQLEAAGHISHDEMSVMLPVDTHCDSKESETPKSDLFKQNMYMKFKQDNTQVQRTKGFSGTIGPKAKTLAEKRRLLEQEMKLTCQSKKTCQSIRGHAMGTRKKLHQEMPITLSHYEKQIIQGIEGKNGKKIDSGNINTFERRTRRSLLWNKKDDDDNEKNENRLPNSKSITCIKEIHSDEDSNVIKERPTKKKSYKKFKKLETHIKLFEKLDSLPKRINDDFELSECNIAEEMANLTGNTSAVGMILNIGVGRHLYNEAVHNLELVQGDNVIIKESMAKFAACAVVDRNAKVTVTRILVPVVCSKLKNLMYQAFEEKRRDHFSQSIQNKTQLENLEDSNTDIDNLDDDPNIVDEGAVQTVVDIVNYVLRRESNESFDKNICYDPDVPEPVVTKKTLADYASKYKKPKNKRKGDKVGNQLDKLGVTLIALDGEPVSSKSYEKKVCYKEYCKFGCVCESLQIPPRQVTHCGNSYCMFEDKCSCSLYDKLKEKLSPSILRVQKETEKKMAKEERKYHQTIIMSKDKMVYSENDKRKREIKLPVKYRDDLIILSEDEELLTAEYESSKPKKQLLEKTLKCKNQPPVKVNVQLTYCNEQSQIGLYNNTKPCYVALEKIDTNGVECLCLLHNIRNCVCLKNSGEDKTDIYERKCKIDSRNVAKKKTSGIIRKKVKKCKVCKDKCVCSVNSNQAGFGVIQEVMSLEPEEFYGTISDTNISESASKSRHVANINSEKNLGCRRLCNNCKRHSNMQFMCDILSSATAPLPVIHAPCRWWVIELEHDDSMVIRNTSIGIDIPYVKLFEAIKEASSRNCTVSLLLKGPVKNKFVYHERYGAYAVPGFTKVIFFGPYGIDEYHNLKAFRLIAEKATVGVPFVSANKSHLFPENKSDKIIQKNVLSICDMCKQHFDYGVTSCWWYSESCRNHLIKKSSNQVTHSNYATQNERHVEVEQTKSNGSTMEDVIVMETLDIEEHGVGVIKNEVHIDEVDDFISFEEKELQNLIDEHVLDNETSDKPDSEEIQNVTNKQHFIVYSVSEGKNKINKVYMPFNLNDNSTENFTVKNIDPSVKISSNYLSNNNSDEAVNRTKVVKKKRIIMNKVLKKFDEGDNDRYMKFRISGESKNIKTFGKELERSVSRPLEGLVQQNEFPSNVELLQNGIITKEINKDFSHCLSQKEKEKEKKNFNELASCTSINNCQQLVNVTQAEVNSTIANFTGSILIDKSNAHVTENSVSNYAQKELEVIDYCDHFDTECSSDEDDKSPTDADNSDEEVMFDTSDPHLILHKPKRKLQLLPFGAQIPHTSMYVERSPSESFPKAVLFCEVPGIDAIPVIKNGEDILVIADPLKKGVQHQFQHTVYASNWLQKLFKKYMIFTDEVELSWSLVDITHIITKLPFFNPGILTDPKLVVTPTGIEELEGNDTGSLKKQRYRIKFEYNRKRLERLVVQKQELSNTNMYNLLTKATVIVKQLTKESIDIACNLSCLGRRNRQLKNRLFSLLADLDSETQGKAKQFVRDVKSQELFKHYYCKNGMPSGLAVMKLKETSPEANCDDDDDSDIEVVSVYIPENKAVERTVSTNLKRTRDKCGNMVEEQLSENSEAKKQKCSSSGKFQSANDGKEVSAHSASVTTCADKAEILPEAPRIETSEIVIEKIDDICSSEKDKTNNCSLVGSFNELKRSVNISTHGSMLENVSHQSSSHVLNDIGNAKLCDPCFTTNSVTPGDITPNNCRVKVLHTPRPAICSLPSQKSVFGFSQNNNMSFFRTKVPLKGNEKEETSNQCSELITVHATEVESPKKLSLDSNEVYVLSNSLYNGEKTAVLEKQNKNKALKNVIIPQIQPKRIHVLYNKNEKSILGKFKAKRLVLDTDNISQHMKMALKPCVANTETEEIGAKVGKYKQKVIPTLMCVPNGRPVVLRNNNVRKVTVIKPESIVRPNISVKSKFDGINLNGSVSNGTLENTSQQFSAGLSNKTDEYISQELPLDPNITQEFQNVQHISPVICNTNAGIQQFSAGPSSKADEHISKQISSDLSATQNFQSVVQHISPILYSLSNSGKKRIIIEVSKQDNITSNNRKDAANFIEIEACREQRVNSSSTSAANFQNKSLSNNRNPSSVPKYIYSAKPRTLLPTSSVQNAYVVSRYSPNQQVRVVTTAPNFPGKSVLVSSQQNRPNIGYSRFQPLQSLTAAGQNTRYSREEHLIRPHVSTSQSVRPNVVINQFNNGRGICTINTDVRQPQSLLNTPFQYESAL